MNHNPFKAGTPLRNPDDVAVYIEREADEKILFHIQKMDYVQLISLGNLQGKTSLIRYLRGHPELPDVDVVYIDVSTLDRSSEEKWYEKLCKDILPQLRFIPRDKRPAIAENYSSWRDFLSDVGWLAKEKERRVVIALDEIGRVTFSGAGDFFNILRSIYNSRDIETEFSQLAFLLAGTSYPPDLTQDHQIPYNISQAVYLHDFTFTEVRTLVSEGNWSEEQITTLAERIYYWTNGQPYLTQLLCSYLPVNATENDVDLGVTRLLIQKSDQHHLPRIVEGLEKEARWQVEVARIMSDEGHIPFNQFQPHKLHKKLSQLGVIKADLDGYYIIRNRIYRELLAAPMTFYAYNELAETLNATLVEYFYSSPQQWSAFVATSIQRECISLSFKPDFVEKIERWIKRMDDEDKEWSSIQEYKPSDEVLGELYKIFIAPLKEYLPEKEGSHLILAPFGAPHLWPLHAAFDSECKRYLSQDYMISFIPTLSALQDAYKQAKPSRFAPLGLLNVAYPGEDPTSKSYLDNVVPSARKIADHFGKVTELYNADAKPEAVINRAREKDKNAIHFFCHGEFDRETPERSALRLSDGDLTARRITNEMDLAHIRFVTLGACRTGQAKVDQDDQLVGLIQALMDDAKAEAVVAGLWAVREKPTVALFEQFYGQIAKGQSAVEALHLATQHIREKPDWKHPYYWAAFQLSGLAYQRDEIQFIKNCVDIYQKINESRDELLEKFDARKKEDISEKMRELKGEAARIQNKEELLAFCENIYRFVNKTPELQDLLRGHLSDGPKMVSEKSLRSAFQKDSSEKWVLENTAAIEDELRRATDTEITDNSSPEPISPADRPSWFPPSLVSLFRQIGL